jgi:NTP pyrophosphatase (non-canonical NTP hydrolase)
MTDPINMAREALEFYAENARLTRLIYSDGDAGRRAISGDGGELARTALAALDATPQPVPTFQQRCWPWLVAAFDADKGMDAQERVHRFLEEAFELVQAAGCSEADAKSICAYVYGREPGDIRGEVGDVMNTLAALCLTHDIDMHEAADAKLAEVSTPEKVARIRAKRAARVEGSPLPGFASQPAPVPADAELDALDRQADLIRNMLHMGEKIAWGADTGVIDQQRAALSALRTRLAEVEGALKPFADAYFTALEALKDRPQSAGMYEAAAFYHLERGAFRAAHRKLKEGK